MEKRTLLQTGKVKDIYQADDPALCILVNRDDATALNGLKKGSFDGKGIVNNKISVRLFQLIADAGVPTHFVKMLDEREMLARKVRILPIEVIVRNVAAGSFSKRYGVEEGMPLRDMVLEYAYKNDDLGDPMFSESHILALGLATREQLGLIEEYTRKINEIMKEFFLSLNLTLIDFKLEYGVTESGEILLADEISPDNCRLWDKDTGEKMDKDRFRRDMGGFAEAYHEVLRRMIG